ncbi:MAG: type I restriction enzyme HsdR N-terminal domain-containing protein [Deltaproteobacteria bacterium]|nr:type I restriction enzyme HsdR N-terminal domain-containing protein [Deltaproteobacteria bacterium]
MLQKSKPYDVLIDFVTGKEVPNIGAEEIRQQVERFLVETKGYGKDHIEVDAELRFTIGDEEVRSSVDLVVRLQEKRFMVIKCVPGSLGSRQRETLAAARLLDVYQIPFSVVTDGKEAELLDTVTGELLAHGLEAIPSKDQSMQRMKEIDLQPFPEKRLEREKIIFRSYDEMNINVQRKLKRIAHNTPCAMRF